MKADTIHGLTALRGIAALGVVIFHYHLMIAYLSDNNPIINHLYLMVDFFFVLSGFIMLHVYGHQFKQSIHAKTYLQYLRARFARIYPVHIFTFSITLGLSFIYLDVLTLSDGWYRETVFNYSQIFSQIFLLNGMGTFYDATWNTPAWSISVEWWAYTIFPFAAYCLYHKPKLTLTLLIAFVIIGYFILITHFSPLFWEERWRQIGMPEGTPYPQLTVDVITGAAFLRALLGMAVGILAYVTYQGSWFKNLLSQWLAAPVITLFIIGAVFFDIVLDPFLIVLMAVLILSTAYRNKNHKLLRSRPAVFLGDISYSLYLVHVPILLAVTMARRFLVPEDPAFKGVGFHLSEALTYGGLIGFIALAVLLAYVVHRFIEVPWRAKIKNLGRNEP